MIYLLIDCLQYKLRSSWTAIARHVAGAGTTLTCRKQTMHRQHGALTQAFVTQQEEARWQHHQRQSPAELYRKNNYVIINK